MQSREVGGLCTEKNHSIISAIERTGSGAHLCKVLLVDDEPSILTVLHWALQDLGCEVRSSGGGQAGLETLCRERFDILITDLIMPDLDGVFLLKMAKKLNADMRIIMMTGSPELVSFVEDARSKIDVLLTKPFSLSNLKSAVMRCVEQSDGERSSAGLPENLTRAR